MTRMLPLRLLRRSSTLSLSILTSPSSTNTIQQVTRCNASTTTSKIPDFEVFQANKPSSSPQHSTTAVVFGFGGSPKAQAEKIANVYTEKGHQAFYCILPQLLTFTYDIDAIRACAKQVITVLKENEVERVVTHSLSNNGSILYQQFVFLAKQEEGLSIEGAVFDSAPGPLGWQNIQKYLRLEKFDIGIEKWSPRWQSPLCLPLHLSGVDLANRKPLTTALSNVATQLRTLPRTWPKSRKVPWCGHYMKDHEAEIWPLLFIYAKNDRLLSWRFVEEVARCQEARGRQVLTTKFERSGKGGHVAHLKYHPEEYNQAVMQLLSLTTQTKY